MELSPSCDGNRQDNYIHPDQQCLNMSTILLSLSMSALLILSLGFSFQSPVFAQITSTSANNNIVKNNNFASSFQQVVAAHGANCNVLVSTCKYIVKNNNLKNFAASTPAVNLGHVPVTNISSKGIYKVQLGLNTPISLQSLPKSGFSTYIRFMSATAPSLSISGSIIRIVPIKSFDMTIYDSHGKVLWNKVNQRPSAGTVKLEQVVFPKGTSGDITISIHDIKSTLHNVPTDSVDFAAKVV